MIPALALCLLLADTPEPPLAKEAPPARADVTGYYAVSGKMPGDEKPYEGVAVIVKTGETYLVVWTFLPGGTGRAGRGVRLGDTFSVSWVTPVPDGFIHGVNVYTIRDGRLVGRTGPGAGRMGSETLNFLRPYTPPEED